MIAQIKRSSVNGTVEIKGLEPGNDYILLAGDNPVNAYQAINSKIYKAVKMVWIQSSP